jgi:(2Fe-2S) ferredoxin
MPSGLDIDHSTPIANNIASYHSHILVSTGQSDWTSRIEDAHKDTSTQPWGSLISQLKTAFGRKGPYHSDTQNILITASSLPTPSPSKRTVLFFPAHEELSIPASSTPIPFNEDNHLDNLTSYLAARSAANPTATNAPSPPKPITSHLLTKPTILICSHNSRDTRCGILGPILHAEFTRFLDSHNQPDIRVAMVSHIGGHKWAGNVIVYVPPGWRGGQGVDAGEGEGEGEMSPLAHKAVWYGRVEPRHVEGIVKETVLGGKVIAELCRGVVDRDGRLLRI